MVYLLTGATAAAIAIYPYLLFGSGLFKKIPTLFWILVSVGNLGVTAFLVIMAYVVAFFGVTWPDRVVKSRLFKWFLRGPFTASAAPVSYTHLDVYKRQLLGRSTPILRRAI